MNFNSHTDGVVECAAALVNVVTPGERQGRPYVVPTGDALAAALAAALATAARQRSARWSHPPVRQAMVELGVAARAVFTAVDRADPDAAAGAANGLLERYAPQPTLERHDGEPWHLHFHGRPDRDPSEWGGGVAVALATVVGSEGVDRLGVCGAPRCDRVFVDVSRNGTRRFCSTACQNRVKAATHRARHAG